MKYLYLSTLLLGCFKPTKNEGIFGDPFAMIGSIVGAGINSASQAATNASQERMFNKQLEYNREAEQRNYDYQDKAWERETQYNSPAAQRQRYIDAGLNPSMMMEGQSAFNASMGNVTPSQAPAAPQLQAPQYGDIFRALGDSLSQQAQLENIRADARLKNSQAERLGIDNGFAYAENQLKLRTSLATIYNLIKSGQLSDKQKDYYRQLAGQVEQQVAYNDQMWNTHVQQDNLGMQQARVNYELTQEQIKSLQIQNFWANIEHELGVQVARSTKKRIDTEALLNGELKGKAHREAIKTLMETLPLTPGTEEYDRVRRKIEAEIERNKRLGLPFGISVPGFNLDNLREGISQGRVP